MSSITEMTLPVCPIVDTHCHLDYIHAGAIERAKTELDLPADYFSADVVMNRAKAQGIEFIVNPSVTPKNYEPVIAVAEQFDNVYAAISIHPTDVIDTKEVPDWQARVEKLLTHPKVVAIGETGLDYYWDTSTELIELQKHCLRIFLKLGVQYNLPVILHDRNIKPDNTEAQHLNSHEDLCQEVSAVAGVRGIMHCFSGDTDFAMRMIEKNFYISFAGNVTYKNAKDLQEAARQIPLDKLLVETDAPFLSPVPYRGLTNEPVRVAQVVQKIAELKNISYEEVARVTTQNAKTVFGLSAHNPVHQ